MKIKNKKSKTVFVRDVPIGGGNPIIVQSMTKTFTSDIKSTIRQIKQLEEVGCKIVRCAVPDFASAEAIKKIKKNIKIPLVADIHFDYRLAIESIKNGADKIRINPANIGGEDKLRLVIKEAKDAKIPIRIGLNSGSFKDEKIDPIKKLLSTLKTQIHLFEKYSFDNIIISAKTSDVISTIECYKAISKNYNYPLHLGITEAGPVLSGSIKSSVGLGVLLYEGIGDTIRVSLTGDPVEEVKVGYKILQSLGLASHGIDIISCPTCGRCKSNLIKIVSALENKISSSFPIHYSFSQPLKVAIMGCEVNGPGEAKHSDIALVMGKNYGLLFVHGKPIKKIGIKTCISELLIQIKKFVTSANK